MSNPLTSVARAQVYQPLSRDRFLDDLRRAKRSTNLGVLLYEAAVNFSGEGSDAALRQCADTVLSFGGDVDDVAGHKIRDVLLSADRKLAKSTSEAFKNNQQAVWPLFLLKFKMSAEI